jgi:hypothetical protein
VHHRHFDVSRRTARSINAASLIRSRIDADHFWEGEQEDVTASSTATP